MYACMHVSVYACMYAYMHVCMYVCVYVCVCVCMRVSVHACMYAYMRVCMYACMYTGRQTAQLSCLHCLSGTPYHYLPGYHTYNRPVHIIHDTYNTPYISCMSYI